MFDEIYIQPAAGDDGAALGAALYRAAGTGEIKNSRFPVPFLGARHTAADIEQALAAFSSRVEVERLDSTEATCERAARLIADGRVVGWFRGRMEFGPRALGHRSILADPGDPGMRDRINAMVKMREAFRPFAPAVALEEVDRWFDVPPGTELPYMIIVADVRRPSLCATRITSIQSSAFVLSGEILLRTRSARISAPPPGIESSPASISF